MSKWTKEEQAAHRAELVAALRSGKYKQATNRLVNVDDDDTAVGHCCLGVACDLAAIAGVIPPRSEDKYDDAFAVLPEPVQEWLGFNGDTGTLKESVPEVVTEYDSPAASLAELNDNGWGFDKIADLIEADGVRLEEF